MQLRSPVPSRQRGGFLASEPLLLVGLIILTLYFARELLVPLAFALVLNFLLSPAVTRLEKLRLGRAPAVVLVILIFFSGLGITGWVVTRQVLHVAEMLPDYRENIQSKLDSLHSPVGGAAGRTLRSLETMAQQLSSRETVLNPAPTEPVIPNSRHRRIRGAAGTTAVAPANTPQPPQQVEIIEPPAPVTRELQDFFSPILGPLAVCGIVLIFTIYMLMNREDLRNRMLLLAGMGRLSLMTQALREAAERISTYLVWQFLVNATFGLLFGLGLRFLGVPDATLWGTLAAIMRYIPYVGTAVGGLLPVLFAIAIFPDWKPAFEILGLYAPLEIITANFVEPILYGSRIGVSALALLASAIFWSLLWGLPGLILATPLTVCLIVMGRNVPQLRFLHVLLGDEAQLSPEAKFYERLLAMDLNEARAITDRFLEQKPLSDFYDTVLLPALSLIEQDRHRGSLDESRSNYLLLSATELVAEMSEYKKAKNSTTGGLADVAEVPTKGCAVICVPVGDQADELTAIALAQLLERDQYHTMLLSNDSLTPEVMDRLAQDPATILCVSALPPFVFAQTRALCQRIREQMPHNRILIGMWQSNQSPELMQERFGSARPDRVVSTLAGAMTQIEEWETCRTDEDEAAALQRVTAE